MLSQSVLLCDMMLQNDHKYMNITMNQEHTSMSIAIMLQLAFSSINASIKLEKLKLAHYICGDKLTLVTISTALYIINVKMISRIGCVFLPCVIMITWRFTHPAIFSTLQAA